MLKSYPRTKDIKDSLGISRLMDEEKLRILVDAAQWQIISYIALEILSRYGKRWFDEFLREVKKTNSKLT